MYYANGLDDSRGRSSKEHLLSGSNRQYHPVEVVIKEEEHEHVRATEERCVFRYWYIGILSFVILTTGTFGLVYYFVLIPEKPSEPPSSMVQISPETQSEPTVIFNDWYKTLKQGRKEEFDFDGAISKELAKYYDEILERNHPKYLKKFFNHHHRHLQNIYTEEDFLEFLSHFNSNRINFFVKNLMEMKNPPISLMKFQNFFNRTEELHFWYNYLHDLRNFLSSYEAQKNRVAYSEIVTENNFDSFTNQTDKFECDERKLEELNELLSEFTEDITVKWEKDSMILMNKIVILSEVENYLRDAKNVYVFATTILYLDVDLNLPGVNMAFISPNWIFLNNITINLNGRNGTEYEGQVAMEGDNGKSGISGSNGGDFFGIGNMDEKQLTIESRGGNGSNGQGGAEGRNGIDGGNPDLDVGNPTCVVKDFIRVNQMKEVLVFYDVFDNKGCGQSGTDGGAAGYGGKGGESFLINTNSKSAVVRRNTDGTSGVPGKGGKGGIGGKNGCYYKAICINDRTWNKITTVKCSNKTMPSGKPGKDGGNVNGLIEPETKKGIFTFANAFNEYRVFAREQVTKYNDVDLYAFLKNMDETPAVCNLTEPESLLFELEAIEKSKNVEFYESVIRRIDLVLNCSNNEEHKKMLKQFRLLVLGKMSNLKYAFGNYLVVDLEKYLESIAANLENSITQPKKDKTKLLMKENFDSKLSDIEIVLKEEMEKLEKVSSYHNETIEDLLKNKYLINRENFNSINYCEALANHLDAKRITYLIVTTCKSLLPLVEISRNHLLNNKPPEVLYKRIKDTLTEFENLKRENLKSALKASKATVLKDDENIFDQEDLTLKQRNVLQLSQILIDFNEYNEIMENAVKFSRISCQKFRAHEKDLLGHLKLLLNDAMNVTGVKNHIQKLKKELFQISKKYRVNDNGKYIINVVSNQLEHYVTVLSFMESYSQEEDFIKSLNSLDVSGLSNPVYEKTLEFKNRLQKVLIASQYKHALNAFKQWVFPHIDTFDDISKPTEEMPLPEAVANIELIKRKVKEYKSTISSLDKNVRRANFQTDSAVGEFYLWDNRDIHDDLEYLFAGKTITLKADVENVHVLNKNAIKFRTVALEFRMRDSQERSISELLENFEIVMKHSGYSYYYYKGETYIIMSDNVTLTYSFKSGLDGAPEVYNFVYKKLKEGDIMLSPYTTWSVQLLPINQKANFEKLMEYCRKVDVALVGKGTYVAETNDDGYSPKLSENYRSIRRDQLL